MPTDPTSLFSLSYDQGGRLHTCGGVTSSPDGILFAHEHLIPQEPVYWGVIPVIDWRHWDDFSRASGTINPLALVTVRSIVPFLQSMSVCTHPAFPVASTSTTHFGREYQAI